MDEGKIQINIDVHNLHTFATNQKRLIELAKEMENTSKEFKELCSENEKTIHKIFEIIKKERMKGGQDG